MAHVCQPLSQLARRVPNQLLTTCGGRQQTCGEFAARVACLASALASELGLQPGDRVALAALNTDHHFEALLAVLATGGLVAPLNWRWSIEDALAALAPCTPSILVLDEGCARFGALAQQLSSVRHIVTLGDAAAWTQQLHHAVHAEQLISLHAGVPLTLKAPPNGAAVLCFTSGTTAAPKAAVLPHLAFHVQSLIKLLAIGYCAEEVHYHAAPLCHIGGLSSLFAVLMAGGRHVFPSRFNAAVMLEDLDRHQVTSFIAVPAILVALCDAAGQQRAFTTVQRVLFGGGTPTDAVLERIGAMFPAATLTLSYAMTEACSTMTLRTIAGDRQLQHQVTAVGQQQQQSQAVCVGWPVPGGEIDIQQGDGLPAGQGVIQTRGPHIMLGYWSEGGSALQPHPDRWFSTGDIGYIDDDGSLWLLGRSRDTIRTGGETVHASEVERCLQLHPEVQAAAVVGLPHDRLGQQVAALVQVRSPGSRPPQTWQTTLRGFCKTQGLSGYKIPGVVRCQAVALPANGSGKILKHEVRTIIQQQMTEHNILSKL